MTQSMHNLVLTILIGALILLGMMSLMIGPAGSLLFWAPEISDSSLAILKYRLIRVTLAIVAGSSLAASGASLQAIFRNPLADPHLFGISGGAALGASIVIAFWSDHISVMPSFGAILGGIAAFLLVFFFLHSSKDGPLSHCLLVGVLINSLAAALITVLKTTLPISKTQSLLFWLVGHITMIDPQDFAIILPLWLCGMIALHLIKGELEILSFGVEEGQLLGINAERIIKITIVANCILIGNVVAFAGMIGFLGLVVPHLVRILINENLRIMLPIASLFGALLLVGFDSLSRLSFFIIGSEIPVGAISALFLSPVFFILLLKSGSHE